MERFYKIHIQTLSDPAMDISSMEGLPRERREKCLRYKMEADRKRCLGAGKLIQQILQDHHCTSEISYGTNGKPEAEGVHFSIAHSGDYVIGVASDVPIGCDIEKMKDSPVRVAKRYFTPAEQTYLDACEDRGSAFWKLWTLKESYVKMTGEGLSLPLDQFEIDLTPDITLKRQDKIQKCTLKHMMFDGYCVGICTANRAKMSAKENS